jgi:hypothetical protein
VVVERMPALQRLGWGKSLVVVHHNRDLRAGMAAHGIKRRHVFRKRRITQAQLQRPQPLRQQFLRLVGERGRGYQPEPPAVVGRQQPQRATEEMGKRPTTRPATTTMRTSGMTESKVPRLPNSMPR